MRAHFSVRSDGRICLPPNQSSRDQFKETLPSGCFPPTLHPTPNRQVLADSSKHLTTTRTIIIISKNNYNNAFYNTPNNWLTKASAFIVKLLLVQREKSPAHRKWHFGDDIFSLFQSILQHFGDFVAILFAHLPICQMLKSNWLRLHLSY